MWHANSRIKKAVADLREGLLCPHWSVLAGAGLAFLFSLGAIEYSFRSGLFAKLPLPYLMKDSKDLFMYTSHTLARLRNAPPRGLQVYSIGGSSMAYAFKPDEFGPMLKQRLGEETGFYNFASGMQPLHESIAIVDQLPERSGLVLMGVNPRIMSRELSEERERWRQHHLLLHSVARNRVLEGEGIRDLFLFPHVIWRMKHQLWVHRGAYLRGKFPRHDFQASWFDKDAHSAEKKAWKISKYAERNRKHFDGRIEKNLAALATLVDLCRQKRLGLVLVELPLNTEALQAMGEDFVRLYQSTLRGFSTARGVPYWEYPSLRLLPSEFYDANHVMKSARLRIEKATARHLSRCEQAAVHDLGQKTRPLPPRADCHFGDLG